MAPWTATWRVRLQNSADVQRPRAPRQRGASVRRRRRLVVLEHRAGGVRSRPHLHSHHQRRGDAGGRQHRWGHQRSSHLTQHRYLRSSHLASCQASQQASHRYPYAVWTLSLHVYCSSSTLVTKILRCQPLDFGSSGQYPHSFCCQQCIIQEFPLPFWKLTANCMAIVVRHFNSVRYVHKFTAIHLIGFSSAARYGGSDAASGTAAGAAASSGSRAERPDLSGEQTQGVWEREGQPHTVSAALFSLFSLTSTRILL